MSTSAAILETKSQEQAIEEAKAAINEERSGKIIGLYSRWEGINRAKMKYWRFRSVTCIAGMSGSGKSAILNMLEDDFTNPLINPTFIKHIDEKGRENPDRIILVAFKYEMDAADEILRTLSGKIGKPYSYLLSAEKNNDATALGPANYNKVSDEEFKLYSDELDKLKGRPILYVENAGNLDQLFNTVKHVKESYPGKKVIVTVDHTLLSIKLTEKDDLELMSRTARIAIRLKKELNASVIFLSQLNGNIEDVKRRENIDLHFPVKTDIHAANQIYWACDDVLVFHRPELLNIQKYGKIWVMGKLESLNAQNLIHCNWIKSRKNKVGSIWFKNQFNEGKIIQVDEKDIRFKTDTLLM